MQKIYEADGKYYKQVKACHGRYEGMYLWQPMKKVLFFFVPDKKKEPFILDDGGFRRIKCIRFLKEGKKNV